MIRRVLLAVTAAVLLLANYALRPDPSKHNFEFLPDMAHAVSYQSFSANPNFADGKTLRQPVGGTVIYGSHPLHYAATPEDAARAGRELRDPFPAKDARALARGQVVFQNFCQVCHGPAGKGDGPVALRGFPAPPSLLAPHARGLADGQIFHILTYGQVNMPSYASQIDENDRWRAVLFVRSLQQREK